MAAVAAEGLTREELVEWVEAKVTELQKGDKLSHAIVRWDDGGSDEEQEAISRLGFIFLTYQAPAWWFEVAVMIQKLLMTSGVIYPLCSHARIHSFPFSFSNFVFLFAPLFFCLRTYARFPSLALTLNPHGFLTIPGDSGVKFDRHSDRRRLLHLVWFPHSRYVVSARLRAAATASVFVFEEKAVCVWVFCMVDCPQDFPHIPRPLPGIDRWRTLVCNSCKCSRLLPPASHSTSP